MKTCYVKMNIVDLIIINFKTTTKLRAVDCLYSTPSMNRKVRKCCGGVQVSVDLGPE